MGSISHVSTQVAEEFSGAISEQVSAQMVALSALLPWLDDAGAGPLRLYSAGATGVLGWSAGLTPLDSGTSATSAGLDAPRGLVRVEIGGADLLLAPGRFGAGIEGWRIASGGGLGERVFLPFVDGAARALTGLAVLQLGGSELLVSAARVQGGTAQDGTGPELEVWRAGPEGLTALPQALNGGALAGPGGLTAVAAMTQGASGRILALSGQENSLYCWDISADGQLSQPRRLGVAEGLFLETPTRLELLQLAGQDYALVGSASGRLAVVALAADGTMRVTDLVGDDLATRFAGVTALETITVSGRVYLAAAGADDGLSLMTLLPGGRLLHLATLAGDARMALRNPAALALVAEAAGLGIYAAGGWLGGSGEGISRLRAGLGPIGLTLQLGHGADSRDGSAGDDQIHGGAGNDSLRGGAGDDVLIDGPGQDLLTGGAGADVFVFSADGEADRISDYQPGVDRLDLSALGRVYTVEALDIRSTAAGARITLGGEVLQVDSAAGTPLTAADFDISELRDLWHIDTGPLPEVPLSLAGGAGADLLEGRGAADRLSGGGGPDTLRGGGGDDLLLGEAEDPVFDPVSAQLYRLYRATLGRDPDLAGLLGWSARLLSGAQDLPGAAAAFAASAEFRASYGGLDDAQFVTLLYGNVLGRGPDAVGLAGWLARIDDGMSRARVVLGFSESAEFTAASAAGAAGFSRTALQQDWSDDVYRLYRAVLDRGPDLGGLLGWTARLAGEWSYLDAVRGFTGSAEFRSTYGGLDDRAFVTLLYGNVLGRGPDALGLAGWLSRIDAGMSRAEVVQGFAQSAEFRAATAPGLLAFMRGPGLDDRLEGGGGDNLLIGGMLADTYVIRAGEAGRHEVVGLERWDMLRFEGFGYGSAAEVRAHLAQGGGGVLFADQDSSVILHGTSLSAIHDDMLLF